MSRHNAALSLPLGDRDEAPPSRPPRLAPEAVAERVPNRTVLTLSERCEALRARIARKRRRRESIGGDQSDLIRTRTAQLLAEIKSDKRRKHRSTKGSTAS